jgi:mono/diheme cytochrome c family protein
VSIRLAVAAGALTVGLAALTGWAWSSEPSSAGDGSAELAADGATLFLAKGCATCHDGPDRPALISVAPSLADVSTWAGSRRPDMSAQEYVRESITSPGTFVSPQFNPSGPVAAMPGIAASPAEVDALVEYLLNEP